MGAFYTPSAIVRFMTRWAAARSVDSVFDPSCGDGRFLVAAKSLSPTRLVGCDISGEATDTARQALRENGLAADLLTSDFFALSPTSLDSFDLVIGNPPFIRYQHFNGPSRALALEAALKVGVRLSRMTSSWAPFLLHALQFIRPGGRMAMVVPAEITQTHYGVRTLRALLAHFGHVQLLTFEHNAFDDAQVETALLLASERGEESRQIELIPVTDVDQLDEPQDLVSGLAVRAEDISRFAEAFLLPSEREAWRRARHHKAIRSLSSLAIVSNGYVTGDNEFFHTTRRQAEARGWPATWLQPVVRSGKSLRGLFWKREDLAEQEERGTAHHLVEPRDDLFQLAHKPVLESWLEEGRQRQTHQRFKCRSRDPWWRVPGVSAPDLFVTYMSGAYPRAAVNQAGAAYPNTLHGLKLRHPQDAGLIAAGLYSSVALLSLEIEGRSYGGGVLKVEPRELDRALIPWPDLPAAESAALATRIDDALRAGDYGKATELADQVLLVEGLGLPKPVVRRLRSGRARLMERRSRRSKKKR